MAGASEYFKVTKMVGYLCLRKVHYGEEGGTYAIKMSAIMFIPRNIHISVKQYMIASRTGFNVEIPGKTAQLKMIQV